MTMTYYDRLNKFFKDNERMRLPASAQLLFLHLLHQHNRNGNDGETKPLSIEQLADLTQLNRNTIIEARRKLKYAGLIDFIGNRGSHAQKTLYKITDSGKAIDKDTPAIAPEQPPKTGGYLSTNSAEVLKAWDRWGGVRASGGVAFSLIELENTYGTAKLLAAIETAGKANNRHNLSLNFLKAVLEGKGQTNGTTNKRAEPAENWESKRPDWLDN